MEQSPGTRPSTPALIARLRAILEGQAEALGADDFATMERLSDERDRIVAALEAYGAADVSPADREVLTRIGALDQRLLEMARASQTQTSQELRGLHGGRRALNAYGRRGQQPIHNLTVMDVER